MGSVAGAFALARRPLDIPKASTPGDIPDLALSNRSAEAISAFDMPAPSVRTGQSSSIRVATNERTMSRVEASSARR